MRFARTHNGEVFWFTNDTVHDYLTYVLSVYVQKTVYYGNVQGVMGIQGKMFIENGITWDELTDEERAKVIEWKLSSG